MLIILYKHIMYLHIYEIPQKNYTFCKKLCNLLRYLPILKSFVEVGHLWHLPSEFTEFKYFFLLFFSVCTYSQI